MAVAVGRPVDLAGWRDEAGGVEFLADVKTAPVAFVGDAQIPVRSVARGSGVFGRSVVAHATILFPASVVTKLIDAGSDFDGFEHHRVARTVSLFFHGLGSPIKVEWI